MAQNLRAFHQLLDLEKQKKKKNSFIMYARKIAVNKMKHIKTKLNALNYNNNSNNNSDYYYVSV